MPKRFVIPISVSNNIGNAFFALGIKAFIEEAVGDCEVSLIADQAAYWNMIPGPSYRREPRYSLRYISYLRPDYVVLAGSLLTEQFPIIWRETFQSLSINGVRIMLIGVGQYDYSPREASLCHRILSEYPPYVFISRDSETYKNFRDVAEHSYDGIDGAYFIPEFFKPIPQDMPRYIIINFDRHPEPRLKQIDSPHGNSGDAIIRYHGSEIGIHFPRLGQLLSSMTGKGFAFTAGLLGFHGSNQGKIGDYLIIRTDHQVNPVLLRRIFRGPNSFAADVAESYLNLYANAEFTLSDRIHAVLATMVLGRPAMLFSRSGRARILERMGALQITHELTTLDQGIVAAEKQAQSDFLRSIPL